MVNDESFPISTGNFNSDRGRTDPRGPNARERFRRRGVKAARHERDDGLCLRRERRRGHSATEGLRGNERVTGTTESESSLKVFSQVA